MLISVCLFGESLSRALNLHLKAVWVSPRSVLGQSQVSLRSDLGQTQVRLRSDSGQTQVCLMHLINVKVSNYFFIMWQRKTLDCIIQIN